MKRLGIVGLGNQGREHIRGCLYSDSVKIVAGFDPSAEVKKSVAAAHPELLLVDQLSDLLDAKLGLDGLILALPHHIYQTVLPQLFEARIPLLKEKPLARTMDEARDFVADAKKHGCLLQTAIQRRTHPSYQFLKNLVATENILQVSLTMNLGFNRSPGNDSWREDKGKAGGGALLDCGYHMVDLALYLIGDFDLISSTVFQGGLPCHSQRMDDAFELIGRQGKTWVNIQSRIFNEPDSASPTGYPKFEETKITTENQILRANRLGVWQSGENGQPDKPLYQCEKDWNIAMARQLDTFANAIDQGLTLSPGSLWDQQPAQHLIQQAYQLAFNWHGGKV